ncbi:expressed unknown protein [Seminavis robusta]|uniref:Uncharacterized protein n=1 Tax=Seminavis robusta TaxID=568900 RepID=A0A9N8DVE1_9STRA|nr:expressed unknown protein [Seminavis robusta]|eukprot:Sro311_g114270.1 n/a (675) ;mRNA; f:29603-31715
MNISSADSSLMVEDMKPTRRGSLPFKKRRFPSLELLAAGVSSDHVIIHKPYATPMPEDNQDESGSAEHIAALSLLAAAASSDAHGETLKLSSRQEDWQYGEEANKQHGFALADTKSIEGNDDITLSSALMAAAADLQSLHQQKSFLAADVSTIKSSKAPLLSPLPGGCHGRTSRNFSYCRRHPCYNGSKYCKLHYQHNIAAGVATEKELSSGMIVELPDIITDGDATNAEGATTSGSQLIHQHQDKRYTGCDAEIRCKATTTRGRECAYCAVKGTKYCYLHADYDTNPPPRRGGAGLNTAANSKAKEGSGGKPGGLVEAAAKPAKGKAEGSKRKNRHSLKKERNMADAPYPLLSTIGTDKWLHRKVIVSTGPLTNHVGLVEKWRNGWVSVRLPGVGLHNRRSFELYLHPNSDDAKSAENGAEKALDVVEVFDAASSDGKSSVVDGEEGLDRADSTSTPPTPMLPEKPVMSFDQVHEVTPLVSCRVIGIDQKGGKGSRKMSSIMFPTCMSSSAPDTVPESPVPIQHQPTGFPFERDGRDAGTRLEKSQNESDALESKLKPPIKPTVSEDGDVPLMQSLLLAQQDRQTKHKLGLLFGTAAIERSRRSIHKPVRYEDKELMGKKSRKRDRDSSGDNTEGHSKRVRSEASQKAIGNSSSVISSSDEESFEAPAGLVSV